MNNAVEPKNSIKKLYLEETILFAINNIPRVDTLTLKQFLELINAGGTFGSMTHDQILRKMRLLLKYVPDASVSSLLIVLDLLDIKTPYQLTPLRAMDVANRGEGLFMTLLTGPRQSVPVE